ncbi:MAG: aspartate aminotransferase family protein [Elusimicrobia bacterium HGW-Elusimicrobia-1]|jgi:4-aminobutyrate aminotransferase-like enzyme|nr:MAG: aspartate aminotransferase family protein [Elusimicrobia bacterium HGW-Elusimicrobia-1]
MAKSTVSKKSLSAKEIGELRAKHLLPSTMTYFTEPLNIVKGEMQYVYDDAGKKYLDGFSAVVTISVGHCHPDIVPKIQAQVASLQHMTTLYYHPNIALYAKKMAEVAKNANPALQVSFFTNAGCEANELAALLAKNYTKQMEFVALRHSFHGRTLMAMSLTGQSAWRHSLPYVFGVYHAPAGYCYRCPFAMTYPACDMACAKDIEGVIKYSSSGKIAGFIAEPIQGFGGVVDPPKEYFKIAYDIVKKYGGVFIADEVQTGFGRTGDKFFGIEQWGVKPDIITMAKGIGNGAPLGGIIATADIAESMRGKVHFNTYGGNPVSMAAGLGVLEAIEKYNYAHNAAVVGKHMKEKLMELMGRHKIIGDVRGKGLMLGFELVKDRKTKEPAAKETLRIMDLAKERGLLVGKGAMAGNVIRIKPPLCISKDDADFIYKVLDECLGIVEKESK